MIIGIGHDQVEIERIRRLLTRFGDHFLHRVFSQEEINYANTKSDPAPTLAKRFAAKEACAKALGTGIGHKANFVEISVTNREYNAPSLSVNGSASHRLDTLTPEGYTPTLHLSLSDETTLASAFVIIEATPQR